MKTTILGARGLVGRAIIKILNRHSFLEVGALVSSKKREGYITIDEVEPHSLVFSALPNSVAPQIEQKLLEKGCVVISNASYDRLISPLIHPDINLEALPDSPGRICVPNCVACGLSLALKPFSTLISSVDVTTLQAISGAGYPGVASLDILANVIPYIEGEEEKIESEPLKLLGADFPISATCFRVPVEHGHTMSVTMTLKEALSYEDLVKMWRCEKRADISFEQDFPQPKRDLKEMDVCIGKIKKISDLKYKFVILSHNLIQGAAGASVNIAEAIWQRQSNRASRVQEKGNPNHSFMLQRK